MIIAGDICLLEGMTALQVVCFEYTNWRGETATRRVVPVKIWYGSTRWHQDEQWFMNAYDVNHNKMRDFAMNDMRKFNHLI